MKRSILPFVLMSLISIPLAGQKILGLQAGLANGTMRISGMPSDMFPVQPSIQYQIGLFSSIDLAEGFYFEPSLQFARRGFDLYQSSNVKIGSLLLDAGVGLETRVSYIEMPLLFRYGIKTNSTLRPYLRLGPKLSYATSAQIRTVADLLVSLEFSRTKVNLATDRINRVGLGMYMGAGMAIPLTKNEIRVELGYDLGFSDQVQLPILDIGLRNRSLGINVGYAINF